MRLHVMSAIHEMSMQPSSVETESTVDIRHTSNSHANTIAVKTAECTIQSHEYFSMLALRFVFA